MADDEVPPEFTFPARDSASAQQKAREQHRQFLIDSVLNDEMLPSEAEAIAAGTGLLFDGSDGSVKMTSTKWSLAQAIVWIAWRDPDRIQEQWWRLHAWSGSLWRDQPGEHQVVTFEHAETELWAALEDGRVQATGLAGQGPKPVRIEALDWSNLDWMPDKTRLSVRYFGQRDEAYRCVEVKSADVLAAWPAAGMQTTEAAVEIVEEPSQPREPRKRGGRPTVHDWASAAGFAAAFITENDYPTIEQDLTDEILKWFDNEHGKAPDLRDVQRFVSELYKNRSSNLKR